MSYSPLANRVRPNDIKNFYGQKHLIGENGPLNKILSNNHLPSLIPVVTFFVIMCFLSFLQFCTNKFSLWLNNFINTRLKAFHGYAGFLNARFMLFLHHHMEDQHPQH